MSETLHEYIVLDATGDWEERVETGQSLFYRTYYGKEHTWEFMDMETLEPTGTITGLYRGKTTREVKSEGA